MDAETVYSDDPVEVARRWQDGGAELIHIVDLDAAVEGRTVNFETIKKIVMTTDVPVEVGGGIRDAESVEKYLAFDSVHRVILGTAAYDNPELAKELTRKFPGRIAVGIDAKDGLVAIKGWVSVTDKDALSMARRFEEFDVSCLIYTDIARDGMLSGPNVAAMGEMLDAIDIPLVASGGVSSLEDLDALNNVGRGGPKQLDGVIVGKALYSGDVDLEEAIERVRP
jgi:phosphoribosylformimino-5-aminoimidazole carboxamide ribotide isomerase